MGLNLIVETPDHLSDFEYIYEEKNTREPSRLYVKGPYMMCEETNKNRRRYTHSDMSREVNRYVEEMVKTKRAMGELNHPESAEVNLANACHLVTDLYMEGNIAMGKSQILSTPVGKICDALIRDGVKVGMSSRALGKINESAGVNTVTDMRLIAVDCVADPSCPKAFVNGILEAKQFVVKEGIIYEAAYNEFEKSLGTLPKHERGEYLQECFIKFIKAIKI